MHVGVLSAAMGTAGQTVAVPVWYSYQPGGLLTVLTGRRSRKAAAIRAAGRFGLCAQDASPPYRPRHRYQPGDEGGDVDGGVPCRAGGLTGHSPCSRAHRRVTREGEPSGRPASTPP